MQVRELGDHVDIPPLDLDVFRGAFGTDWLSDQLPGVLAADPFIRRFVRIFQDVVDPLRWTADHLEHLVTPSVAPESELPWLARWIDLPLDTTQPEGDQREFLTRVGKGSPRSDDQDELRGCGDTFLEGGISHRGTRAALHGYLETFLDGTVTVVDSGCTTGSRLPPDQQALPAGLPTARRSVKVTIASDMVVEDHSPDLDTPAIRERSQLPRAKLRIKDVKALIYELVPIGTDIEIELIEPAASGTAANAASPDQSGGA